MNLIYNSEFIYNYKTKLDEYAKERILKPTK